MWHTDSVLRINWVELASTPARCEELLAYLLIRTVPVAKRVDGAGGDDGADVIATTIGGDHVYQIKSFAERLTSSRRNKIAESLKTAIAKRPNMVAWTLVLPLDLTPGESAWFEDKLRSHAPRGLVPTWIGRAQIMAELSKHRDLIEAYITIDQPLNLSQNILSGHDVVYRNVVQAQTIGGVTVYAQPDGQVERIQATGHYAAYSARDTLEQIRQLFVQWPDRSILPIAWPDDDSGLVGLLRQLDRQIALVPHEELRHRFGEIHTALGYGGLLKTQIGTSIFTLAPEVCDHGVKVLSAYLRGDTLPRNDPAVVLIRSRFAATMEPFGQLMSEKLMPLFRSRCPELEEYFE